MAQLLKDQMQGSPLRGLPVDDTGDTSVIVAVTGETIQLYYSNSGTRTADAGQAAGVVVEGITAFSGIQNAGGDTLATTRDSSLSFTSTAFTTLKILSYRDMEVMDEMSFAERFAYVTSSNSDAYLSANGDYCVDYRKGVLYGIKASTQTTLTSAAYKYQVHPVTATFTTTPTVIAKIEDTAGNPLTSTSGQLNVIGVSPSYFSNFGANATLNVKSSAGVVMSAYCHNSNASTRYLQLHNTATTPGAAAVPKVTILVPGNSIIALGTDFFGTGGVAFSTGIAFAFSTTEATYTAGTAGEQTTQITYA